jgi:hypothetical protein
MTTAPINIRPAGAEDMSFVLASFKSSLKQSPVYRGLEKNAYYSMVNPIIDIVIQRSRKWIAEPESDADGQILGWIAELDGAIAYAYTKQTFRRLGIFGSLWVKSGCPKKLLFWGPDSWLGAGKKIIFDPGLGS